MKSKSYCLVACALLFCVHDVLAIGVVDANKLQNPFFEDGLLGWTSDSPDIATWVVNFDFNDPASKGYGAVAILDGSGTDHGISQCISVQENQTYSFWAWALPFCDESAYIEIEWSNSECTTAVGSVESVSTSIGVWEKLAITAQAPPGTQAAWVRLFTRSRCNNVVFFDDTFFGDRIFSNSFE
ncbi:MAG: hypothetical protein ABJB01_06430 [Rudaea sp.]